MNLEFKKALLKNARSGKFKKVTGFLKKKDTLGNGFCFLGLCLETAFQLGKGRWVEDKEMSSGGDGVPFYWEDDFYPNKGTLPQMAVTYMGFDDVDPELFYNDSDDDDDEKLGPLSVTELNDNRGLDFLDFADLIEEQW